MLDCIIDALLDTLKLLPFLFLTYLLMEWIEHKAGKRTENLIKRAGRLGPVAGGLLGALPQCGFSAAASGLYSGSIISTGTLLAIFLSTSDEMLPVMISHGEGGIKILKILGIKVIVGIAVGLAVDLVISLIRGNREKELHIESMCEQEHCHCEGGIFRSALHHVLHISLFILLISLVLNLALFYIGEDKLASVILDRPVVANLLAGIVGLIPNCAASVAITELYLGGVISAGAMLSGLLVGAGVGLLVLFRVNRNIKRNLAVLLALYVSGTLCGILFDLLGLAALIGI